MSQILKSQNEIFEEILKACEVGDLYTTQKLIKDIQFKSVQDKTDDMAYEIFIRACMHGHLNLVKEFINDPYTNQHMNCNYVINEALLESNYADSLDVISHLINDTKINRSDKFYSKIYLAGLNAAQEGKVDNLKALLNLGTDKTNRSILENGRILEYACNKKQYKVIEYIYTEPELQGFFNKDNCFKYVCIKKDFDVLRFFVCNLNIEKTQTISDFLSKNEYRDIENLFDLRKLNQHLNVELDSNKNTNKKLKL